MEMPSRQLSDVVIRVEIIFLRSVAFLLMSMRRPPVVNIMMFRKGSRHCHDANANS